MDRILYGTAKRYATALDALYKEREIHGKAEMVGKGARHLTLGIRLHNPLHIKKALDLAEPLALACRVHTVIARRGIHEPGLVVYHFQLSKRWWESYTRDNVTGLGLGLAEEGRQIDYAFEPPHSLIAGATGSGKSKTIESALLALFTTQAPDSLQACIVDPHRDLDPFANSAHLAHPIDRNGCDALAYAVSVLKRRKAQNIRDGCRLLVVIDEAEAALQESQNLIMATAIAKEGRKFRLNLMLGSQAPREKTLPGGLLRELSNRFVGLVDNAQTSAMLTGQAGLGAHQLTGAGDFYHVAGSTVERLQVALPTEGDIERIPRVEEVPTPEPEMDPAELPALTEDKRGPGRPRLEVQPRTLASYLYAGSSNISTRQAQDDLGLSIRHHRLHREFAQEVESGLEWLQEQNQEVIG